MRADCHVPACECVELHLEAQIVCWIPPSRPDALVLRALPPVALGLQFEAVGLELSMQQQGAMGVVVRRERKCVANDVANAGCELLSRAIRMASNEPGQLR